MTKKCSACKGLDICFECEGAKSVREICGTCNGDGEVEEICDRCRGVENCKMVMTALTVILAGECTPAQNVKARAKYGSIVLSVMEQGTVLTVMGNKK